MSNSLKQFFKLCTICTFAWGAPLLAQEVAYQCIDEHDHVTLQNMPCQNGDEQIEMELMNYSQSSSDGLREYELVLLERFHEFDLQRAYFEHSLENMIALEQEQYRNQEALERLRHDFAKEMFDKHYRHYWLGGYNTSNGLGSISLGVSRGFSPITFGNSNETTQTANSNNNNEGM